MNKKQRTKYEKNLVAENVARQSLLAGFGVETNAGFGDGGWEGVATFVNEEGEAQQIHVGVGGETWRWLRMLLAELQQRRMQALQSMVEAIERPLTTKEVKCAARIRKAKRNPK